MPGVAATPAAAPGVHMSLLEIDDLTVRYGPVAAVRGVDLHVDEGEIVALLGANGAGKSSLLGAVAGLRAACRRTRSRSTAAAIGGRAAERIVRRGVALAPEGRRVFPRLTSPRTCALGAAARGDRDGDRGATAHACSSSSRSCGERLWQAAGTLSGGQQQMLAIGRALMSRPRLLLLDEPSLGLAPMIVEQIFELIGGCAREGMTILLVEQNAHRALDLADRAYVLATGASRRQGTRRRGARVVRDRAGLPRPRGRQP